MSAKAIRVLKFKVVKADKEDRKQWRHTANQVKRITNAIWRIWLVEHTKCGNDHLIRQYMKVLSDWHNSSASVRGVKPKCEVPVMPKAIASVIRQYLTMNYGDTLGRVCELVINTQQKNMCKASTKSSYPVWMQILADSGEYPNASNPQPIPFDKRNSEIIVPIEQGDDFHLKLRMDCEAVPGRKARVSAPYLLKLQTKGRRVSSQTALLWKVACGEFKFCGSNLTFRQSTGEWFAHICYQAPVTEKPEVNPEKTAVLKAARNRPWSLRIGGFNFYTGGRSGRHVEYVRRQLLTQRWGRQEGYRHAGSARKGHGRNRAIGKLFTLQNRWKDFVKTANQQLVKEVIDRCIENGTGRLVYLQPCNRVAETRFLFNAGKVPGRNDGTGWDWFQVKSLLAEKCDEKGIELIVRKSGEARFRSLESTETQNSETVVA